MTRNLDASVIVLSYNQPETVALCISALAHQTFDGTFEVIVGDDGSGAATFDSLRTLLESAPMPARLTWQQDRGMRPAAARNNGCDLAKGNVLIFLDGDMVPERALVDKHVRAHREESRLIVAGNRLWRILPDATALQAPELWRVLDSVTCMSQESLGREKREKAFRAQILKGDPSLRWRATFGCNFSVRRQPEVRFDEEMHGWGPEDWELACRLTNDYGYRTVYDSDITAWQVEAPGIFFNAIRRNNHNELVCYMRNVFYFIDKYAAKGLDLTPVLAFGFERLSLDDTSDQWTVAPKDQARDGQDQLVLARKWLAAHAVHGMN